MRDCAHAPAQNSVTIEQIINQIFLKNDDDFNHKNTADRAKLSVSTVTHRNGCATPNDASILVFQKGVEWN